MSIKITGLDKLQQELADAQRALKSLDGTITTVKFDPTDTHSVQSAIRQMEQAVDSKVSRYARNPLVAPIVLATKQRYRTEILKMARGEKT